MLKAMQILIFFTLFILSCSGGGKGTLQKKSSAAGNFLKIDSLLAIADSTNAPDDYKKLGQEYFKNNEPDKAILSYQKAISIDSLRYDIRMQLAGHLYFSEDIKQKKIGLKEFKAILKGTEGTKYKDEIISYLYPYQIKQLTNESYNSAYPSWSHDGSRIYFQTDKNGNWDIASINAFGADLKMLIHTSANEEHPSPSFDGRYIAYTTDQFDKRDIFKEQRWREIMVYDMRLNTTKQITRNYLDDFYPHFNSFNNEMTYITEEANPDITDYGARKTYLNTMDYDGTFQIPALPRKNFYYNSGIKWKNNDDEEVFLYSANEDNKYYNLYYYNNAKKSKERLTNDEVNHISVEMERSGKKRILFTSDKYGSLDIFLADHYLSRIIRVTNYKTIEDQAKFSPDGKKIIFHSNFSGNFNIYFINLESDSKKRTLESVLADVVSKINSL